MANTAHLFSTGADTGDSSLATVVRDPLLQGVANSGVRFIADLSFGYCYPGGALAGRPAPGAPADAAVVYDVADTNNAAVRLVSGDVIGYSGGGFAFDAITKTGNYLEIPASVSADIYNAFNGNSQYFLICMYVKIPTAANFNTNAQIAPMLQFAGVGAATYQNTSDLVAIVQNTGGYISARRQNGAGSAAVTSVLLDSADYGLVTQIAYWRNASGVGIRVRNSNGTKTATGAIGTANSQDFSAKPGMAGIAGGFWSTDGNGTLIGVGQVNAKKFSLYRLFIENLARSGRDPVTVLDADYGRVIDRGVFS